MNYARPLARLVGEFEKLPGIGPKSAQRLAFYVLRAPADDARQLAEAILEVKDRIRLCSVCFNFTDQEVCEICRSERRDPALLCVVAEPRDLMAMERTNEYRGLYHVLGGALSPIDGIDADDLRIDELVRRVETGGVEEVVIATNPTTTGEATAHHIGERLRDRVTLTRLASGLPVGADLEHADEVTLGRALTGRRSV